MWAAAAGGRERRRRVADQTAPRLLEQSHAAYVQHAGHSTAPLTTSMCLKPVITSVLSSSQPMPPAPTASTLASAICDTGKVASDQLRRSGGHQTQHARCEQRPPPALSARYTPAAPDRGWWQLSARDPQWAPGPPAAGPYWLSTLSACDGAQRSWIDAMLLVNSQGQRRVASFTAAAAAAANSLAASAAAPLARTPTQQSSGVTAPHLPNLQPRPTLPCTPTPSPAETVHQPTQTSNTGHGLQAQQGPGGRGAGRQQR